MAVCAGAGAQNPGDYHVPAPSGTWAPAQEDARGPCIQVKTCYSCFHKLPKSTDKGVGALRVVRSVIQGCGQGHESGQECCPGVWSGP